MMAYSDLAFCNLTVLYPTGMWLALLDYNYGLWIRYVVGLFVVRYAAEDRINDGFTVHSLSCLLAVLLIGRLDPRGWVRGGRLRPVRLGLGRTTSFVYWRTASVPILQTNSHAATPTTYTQTTHYTQMK